MHWSHLPYAVGAVFRLSFHCRVPPAVKVKNEGCPVRSSRGRRREVTAGAICGGHPLEFLDHFGTISRREIARSTKRTGTFQFSGQSLDAERLGREL